MSPLYNPDTDGGGAPAASTAGKFHRITYTAGNITLNGTTWAAVPGPGDLVLTGLTTGQVVAVGVSTLYGTEAVFACLDFASWVSGAGVKAWSTSAALDDTHTGAQGWYNPASTAFIGISGEIPRAIEAGDLVSGTLTLKFIRRTITAANKSLLATADRPLIIWARVLG